MHMEFNLLFQKLKRKWDKMGQNARLGRDLQYFFSFSPLPPARPHRVTPEGRMLQSRRFTTPYCRPSTRPAALSGPIRGRAGTSGRGTINRLASDFPHGLNFRPSVAWPFFRFLFPRLSRDSTRRCNLGTKASEPDSMRVATNNTRQRYTHCTASGGSRPPYQCRVQPSRPPLPSQRRWTGMGEIGLCAQWLYPYMCALYSRLLFRCDAGNDSNANGPGLG